MKERGGAGREGQVGASPASDGVGWSTAAATVPTVAIEAKTKAWDTRKIGWRFGADAVAAASAGILVAPIITVIDRYDDRTDKRRALYLLNTEASLRMRLDFARWVRVCALL
jgi:hypothetical protein